MQRDVRAWLFYFLAVWIPIQVFAAVITWLLFRTQESADHTLLLAGQRQTVRLAALALSSSLDAARSDLLYLTARTLLEPWPKKGLVPLADQPLAKTYLTFMNRSGRFDQLRLIGRDGQELVRVNWNRGHPAIVARNQLQNKHSRDYVRAGFALSAGQVYISPLDLNIEHGKIASPPTPEIRLVTPIFDAANHHHGLVVLNFSGKTLLQKLDSIAHRESAHLWLLNDRGFWLAGGEPGYDWAFMYPQRQQKSLPHKDPALWKEISQSSGLGQFTDRFGLFTFARILPAPLRLSQVLNHAGPWFVVSDIPSSSLFLQRHQLVKRFLLAYLGLSMLLAIGSALYASGGTRRHVAEQSLRQSEAKFRALVGAAPDAIVITDHTGQIVLTNKRAEEFFGYADNELVGKPVERLIPEPVAARHVKLRRRYWDQPTVRPMGLGLDLKARRKDGKEFPVEISLSPVPVGRETLVFSAIRDVTERRETEREIRQLNGELARQNSKLIAVNQELESFSYSVSHDLRTPLRAIAGFSKILRSKLENRLDPQSSDYLLRIAHAAARMGELIDDLLDLSRITRSEVKYEKVDLSALVEVVAASLREAQPGRDIGLWVEPGLRVFSDCRLLRIALENLLGNAWKFSAGRTDVQVDFGTEQRDGEQVYYVKDNGVGFDMAYADKLFGAFQRLHDSAVYPGTGIGLATVQRIIHKLGGHIWADAKEGQGATFYFTLGTRVKAAA